MASICPSGRTRRQPRARHRRQLRRRPRSDSNPDANADAGTDSDTHPEADADTDSHADTDTEADPHADSDANAEPNPDPDSRQGHDQRLRRHHGQGGQLRLGYRGLRSRNPARLGGALPASGTDLQQLDWKYLNGSKTAPSTGLTKAILFFRVPHGARDLQLPPVQEPDL